MKNEGQLTIIHKFIAQSKSEGTLIEGLERELLEHFFFIGLEEMKKI